jgi:NAD(P)H-quinone oxidoreductase subunit 6
MTAFDIIAVVFGAGAITFGAMVVLTKNIIRAAFSLMGSLICVAGLYITLNADFLAGVQLLVYVGGVVVLVLFGIMFTEDAIYAEIGRTTLKAPLAAILSVAIAVLIIKTVMLVDWNVSAQPINDTASAIGDMLLTRLLLPFEVMSVLLLAVLIGIVYLVRKEVKETE